MTPGAAPSRVRDLLDELRIDVDPRLVELSLTHRSWAYENGGADHNERLEFLGDSVLGVVVTELLELVQMAGKDSVLRHLRANIDAHWFPNSAATKRKPDFKMHRLDATGTVSKYLILSDFTSCSSCSMVTLYRSPSSL